MRTIQLKKIAIENFKAIKELTIEFGPVTNICGQNGIGKTSIYDAFCWVMFDKMSDGSQADKIRPHDAEGKDVDFIDIRVEVTLLVDEKEIVIEKIQRQKWTKPRGAGEKRFDGNINEWTVNSIPKKLKDYRRYIDDLIAEDVFKFSTNAEFFLNMKPKERRAKLFELVSDIDDMQIIENNSELAPLQQLLTEFSIEELMSRNAKAIKEYRKKQQELPVRIDELEKTIVEVDSQALESEKKKIERNIDDIEQALSDASKGNEVVTAIASQINEKKIRMMEIESDGNKMLHNKKLEAQNKKDDAELDYQRVERDKNKLAEDIAVGNSVIEALSKRKQELGNSYEKVYAETFNDNNLVCPTCGREYTEERKEEARIHFERDKQSRLQNIVTQGNEVKAKLEKSNAKLQELERLLKQKKEQVISCMGKINKAKEKLEKYPAFYDTAQSEEYMQLANEVAELSKKTESHIGVSMDQHYMEQKKEWKKKLDEVNKKLAVVDANISTTARIEDLKNKMNEVSESLAKAEQEKMLYEAFNSKKIELLTDKINKHFRIVKWRLFEPQINGGYAEICEPTINGTLYSNGLNKGHKVVADLDIVSTLQRINDVNVPVFLDDSERINKWNIPEMNCQLIKLERTDELEMKVEVA